MRIADSRICRWLLWAYVGLCLFTLLLLYRAGYLWLAALLFLPVSALLASLLRSGGQRHIGAQLGWRAGQWTLDRGRGPQPIELLASSCAHPWVIYVSWREMRGGDKGSLWVFPDAVNRGDLRALRVRLTLQRKCH